MTGGGDTRRLVGGDTGWLGVGTRDGLWVGTQDDWWAGTGGWPLWFGLLANSSQFRVFLFSEGLNSCQ